jgi:hypothetical protein
MKPTDWCGDHKLDENKVDATIGAPDPSRCEHCMREKPLHWEGCIHRGQNWPAEIEFAP